MFFHLFVSLPSAIDCAMSDWTEWSECNKSCGKGHTIRTRAVTMEPQFGGDPCPETIQRKKCKVRKCSRGQGNNDEKKRRKEQREKRRSKQVKTEVTSEHPGGYNLIEIYRHVHLFLYGCTAKQGSRYLKILIL